MIEERPGVVTRAFFKNFKVMQAIPNTDFLLRVDHGVKILARKGVLIEVTEDEFSKFRKKFVGEFMPEDQKKKSSPRNK